MARLCEWFRYYNRLMAMFHSGEVGCPDIDWEPVGGELADCCKDCAWLLDIICTVDSEPKAC